MRTAAYFAVGLNEFLDEGPIQHREVRWYESQVLLKLSPNITYKLRSMQQQLDTNWDGKGVPPSRTPTPPAPALVTFKPVLTCLLQSAGWMKVVTAVTIIPQFVVYVDDVTTVVHLVLGVQTQFKSCYVRIRHAALGRAGAAVAGPR